jgi:hypothetical protein
MRKSLEMKTGILDKRGAFLTLLVLALGGFMAVNLASFPLSVPWMRQLSGGRPILDMEFWYSASTVYSLFDVLGEAGRRAYLQLLWTIDLILPTLFGLFLSSAIRRTPFRRLNWLPFLASGFDYGENIAISLLLVRYPVHMPALVAISSMFTLLKQMFYGAGVLLTVAGAGRSLYARISFTTFP